MNTKAFFVGLALVLGSGYALPAFSQAKPQVLVKQRQAAMTLQGKYFGPLAAMAKEKLPYDGKVAARNAGYLDALTEMPWDGFAPSTKNEKSRALPAVYSEPAKFKEAQERLKKAVDQLVAASKDGNEEKVKSAIGGVGKACGSCHDDFREKKQ
jgi:cytochrome c556